MHRVFYCALAWFQAVSCWMNITASCHPTTSSLYFFETAHYQYPSQNYEKRLRIVYWRTFLFGLLICLRSSTLRYTRVERWRVMSYPSLKCDHLTGEWNFYWSTDLLTAWLIDWVSEWVSELVRIRWTTWLIDLLCDWLIDWLINLIGLYKIALFCSCIVWLIGMCQWIR